MLNSSQNSGWESGEVTKLRITVMKVILPMIATILTILTILIGMTIKNQLSLPYDQLSRTSGFRLWNYGVYSVLLFVLTWYISIVRLRTKT